MGMLPFRGGRGDTPPGSTFNPEVIPRSMDIFYRTERSFLPEGKDFEDLTEDELARVRSRYRFSPLRPGMYQAITGIGGRRGSMLY